MKLTSCRTSASKVQVVGRRALYTEVGSGAHGLGCTVL